VAEVEQRPLAALALVARHDRRLGAAACGDRPFARGAPGEHLAPILFQPGEERGIAQQSVLDHLGVAGAKLARRQRIKQRGVCQNQDRLMKGADQVLAVAGIDGGFAAD